MHRDDQMTPNERMRAYFSGEEVDRLPIMPMAGTISAKMAGMTQRERRSSAKNDARAQIHLYEELGLDGVGTEWGGYPVGRLFGSKINDPEDRVPAVVDHVIKHPSQIDELHFEPDDLNKDPGFIHTIDTLKYCIDALHDEVGTAVIVQGPFTAAAGCWEISQLLRATIRDPESVHKLMKVCTQVIEAGLEKIVATGGGVTIVDPVASGSVISRDAYLEFVQPYMTEIVQFMKGLGAGTGYHICGNTNAITRDMVDTGATTLSVDALVDLEKAKEEVGDRVTLVGNVDPIDAMMLGGPEEIEREIRKDLRKAWDSPRGFILATGCDTPLNAPVENLYTFMDIARRYARYPVDPARFEEPEGCESDV